MGAVMLERMFAKARPLVAGVVLGAASAACAPYEVTGPQGNLVTTHGADTSYQIPPVIRMYDFSASPGGMTIPAGTSVEWINVSAQTHSVSNYSTHPQAATWDDALLEPGGEFSHVFSTAGEYGFVCIFHQEVGYITVLPGENDDVETDDDRDADTTDIGDMPESYQWQLPPGFPAPRVPADDPMTEEKVALGRHLFYDERMSGNETMSCASCHRQSLAFTDGRALSVGSTGAVLPRSSMTLTNIGYSPVMTWGNHTLMALREQMLVPMFAPDPVELGLPAEQVLLDRLRADSIYQSLFAEAYPDDTDPFTLDNVTRAIASFERGLISGNAPEDRFRRGDASALSTSAQAGRRLFFSEEVGCFKCHSGKTAQNEVVFFTSNFVFAGRPLPHIQFDNTGLYNLVVNGEQGWYPAPNTGMYAITGRPADMGKFKVPDLRNVALTAPYMHDGSIATLEEVIDHYAAGGRTIESGPNAGIGSANPNKSGLIKGFTLTVEQRTALINYLEALTDQDFITDSRFSNPWPPNSPAHGVS